MNPNFPHPTAEEWRKIDFDAIFAKANEPTYQSYQTAVQNELNRAENEATDLVPSLALAWLALSMIMQTSNGQTELKPFMSFGDGSTTMTVSQFDERQLETFVAICPEVNDPEFRARIADILWTRTPHSQWAKIATTAYLDSARRLMNLPFEYRHRLGRALDLAPKTGKESAEKKAADEFVEHFVSALTDGDPNNLSFQVLEAAMSHKVGPQQDLLKLAMKSGGDQQAKEEFHWATSYFAIAQQCALRLNDIEAHRAAVAAEAEAHFAYGAMMDNGDPSAAMGAAHHYGTAINTYRKAAIDDTVENRIEEIHTKMLETQSLSLDGMQEFSVSADVPPELIEMVEGLKGKEFHEVINTLLTYSKLGSPAQLRERALQYISQAGPLSYLFPTVLVKDGGLTDAQTAPSDFNSPSEERIQQEIGSISNMARQFWAVSFIEPVGKILFEEHQEAFNSIGPILNDNGFVPPGREAIYLKGLFFGFHGQFDVAAHILIPQLEHSIRYLLKKSGKITSNFKQTGVQDPYDLNTTLHMPELKDLIGEDIVSELITLLVSRFGANLRNNMMHGLVNDQGMKDPQFAYLWVLTLRLLVRHIKRTEKQSAE